MDKRTCNCQSSTRAVRVSDGSQQKADVVKTDYSNSLLINDDNKDVNKDDNHNTSCMYNRKLKQIKQNTITIIHNRA